MHCGYSLCLLPLGAGRGIWQLWVSRVACTYGCLGWMHTSDYCNFCIRMSEGSYSNFGKVAYLSVPPLLYLHNSYPIYMELQM